MSHNGHNAYIIFTSALEKCKSYLMEICCGVASSEENVLVQNLYT